MVIILINNLLNINFNEIGSTIIKSIFSLMLIFLITKIIGRKQVSELNLFDYVISISIGNFAAEIATNNDIQAVNSIFALLVFGFLATLVSVITMKSIILRRTLIGTPVIIIQDGKFIYNNFKKMKIDMNDFLETARIAGYFDISEIKIAVMEVNGKISFLPKEENKPLTIKDMNLKIKKQGLCSNVIIDGKIIDSNLLTINKDKKWLLKELKIKGYKRKDDILLATVDINEKLNIYEKNENEKIINVLE